MPTNQTDSDKQSDDEQDHWARYSDTPSSFTSSSGDDNEEINNWLKFKSEILISNDADINRNE